MSNISIVFDDYSEAPDTLLIQPGTNLVINDQSFRRAFGNPTSIEDDLLILASSIFTSDLAIKRGDRENITREINLKVPVVNLHAFNNILSDLKYVLYRLSHDAWNIQFVQRDGIPEQPELWESNNTSRVLLFSGGLDSFSSAIDLGESGEQTHLVSHLTGNRIISNAQNNLYNYLDATYSDKFSRFPFRIGGRNKAADGFPFPTDKHRETSQRTRSFLFLSLAGIIARRAGSNEVVFIAENGPMAIHLPLTAARISAFSTHTAHPEFVDLMAELLTNLLGYTVRITNPFLYLTKSEVVSTVVSSHSGKVPETISCWRTFRVAGPSNHCGFCIPCLFRRIALESHGLSLSEYRRDLFIEDIGELPADDVGKRNLLELGEFIKNFEGDNTQANYELLFPELVNNHFESLWRF